MGKNALADVPARLSQLAELALANIVAEHTACVLI